jgi:hypothetical protein
MQKLGMRFEGMAKPLGIEVVMYVAGGLQH